MKIENKKVLVTGGAGFIGSNLVDRLLAQNNIVICLDNFATGKRENLANALQHPAFTLIEGDIRNYEDCQKAVEGCQYVLHQAALGSVPRSIADPMTSTDVNIGGFVKMLHAAKEANVKRFVYAASSSTYGDSKKLPKIENEIGRPLSPYAITKYVDELYADVFAKTYGMQCIGLRYFNVFGKRQTPDGAYAAVIPLWVKSLIKHESPYINGDGSYSRDFTYIENVIHANEQAMLQSTETIYKNRETYYNEDVAKRERLDIDATHFSEVFNVAFGGNTNLNQLFNTLRNNLAKHDPNIAKVDVIYRDKRPGDIPHSQASIFKAQTILNYQPKYSAEEGFARACEWYFENIKA
ncbi:Vi polysaccharide biosynthesis protein VipB/TviC [Draconibacterium orientale]|uniref:Vi polysaccharide biosynthesis protein VipB/TviC n=1 Tax=Draconibacterium orientale TaxID=1168034 RepID=A0ABM5QC97_9BACT|nr:SDR family oxidoreductase [Draconibacterium orientale]AHW61316.1 Vi polysaccharide biosynthesis protein VipB/TviC [Draconibacterium orientale]